MAGIPYTKHLTLSFGGDQVECQLTTAQLVDEPEGAETLTSFCTSEDTKGVPKYTLNISGYQSWSTAEDVFELLHAAYLADPPDDVIACVLEVGGKTRSFDARPVNDAPFGGDAGAALTADVALAVVGDVTDGTATP